MEVQETSSLCRILVRNPEAINLPDGDVVSGEQCLIHLLEINFSDFRREPDVDSDEWAAEPILKVRDCDWELAASIIKSEKVKWAVRSFKPFKFAGPDFPGAPTRGVRTGQQNAYSDAESMSCFGLYTQNLEAGEDGIYT